MGRGAEFVMASCVYTSARLSASQEGVLGQCQRAWLPGVQKEMNTVQGVRVKPQTVAQRSMVESQ